MTTSASDARSNTGPLIEVGLAARSAEIPTAATEVVHEALAGLQQTPSVMFAFASRAADLASVVAATRTAAPRVPLLGATGEILNTPNKGSVVALAIGSPHLQVHIGAGRGVSRSWSAALEEAMSAPEIAPWFDGSRAPWTEATRQGRSAFAVLFSPGTTRTAPSCGYEILETLKRRTLGRLPIFGASTADDLQMQTNAVLSNGEVHADGLVIGLFETELQFGIALAHGLRAAGPRARVTSARGHDVFTLDGRPAVEAYAELVGVSPRALEGRHVSLESGRVVGTADPLGDLIPNVAAYTTQDGAVRFGRALEPGTELHLLEFDERATRLAGREAVRKAMLRGGIVHPAVALGAVCALRPALLGLSADGEVREMTEALDGAPVVGFFSLGEQGPTDDGVSQHTNFVVAALVLGRELSPMARVAHENDALRRALELEQDERFTLLAQLAAGVGHEINNPLTVLLSSAELLAMELPALTRASAPHLTDELNAVVAEMGAACQRIKHAVVDLRALSPHEEGPTEELELGPLLVEIARTASREPGTRIEVALEPAPRVVVHPARLRQVLRLLLAQFRAGLGPTDSSVEFDGNASETQPSRILVRLSEDAVGHALVEIEPASGAAPRSSKLEGLALAIGGTLVTAMGGKLTTSTSARGRKFELRLVASPRG
ncbi:MAG: FIST N-terminal domain-containing protein [Polyangiaceae bacterium]